jgi:hypothetical protein
VFLNGIVREMFIDSKWARLGRTFDRLVRGRASRMGRGPVWRDTSVPTRLTRSALGFVVGKLGKDSRQVNEPYKAIWDLCDGVRTVDEIAAVLQATVDLGRGDVMHTLQILADSGFLTSSDTLNDVAGELLDLRDIRIFVINSQDRPDRREFMQRQMDALELPFSFVTGIKHSSPIIGCALAHLSIINQDIRTPFMILEDDCEFTRRFHYRYVLPRDADALYLGASAYGLMPVGAVGHPVWGGVRFTRFGPNYLRVLNMLSSHAKIYLSEDYLRAVTERATLYCHREAHIDAVQASLHVSHLVLTPNQPVCHQSKIVGGQYKATRRSLLEVAQR